MVSVSIIQSFIGCCLAVSGRECHNIGFCLNVKCKMRHQQHTFFLFASQVVATALLSVALTASLGASAVGIAISNTIQILVFFTCELSDS